MKFKFLSLQYLLCRSVIFCLLLSNPIKSFAYGVAVGSGYGRPGQLQAYYIAADWAWHKDWFASNIGALTGYYELKLTHYESRELHHHRYPDQKNEHSKNNSLSFIPMFRYVFLPDKTVHPFIEAGVGTLVLQKTRQSHRKLSTSFQFDDRINVGINLGRHDQYEISLGYNHISNAGIKKPNCGIDQKVVFTFRYWL